MYICIITFHHMTGTAEPAPIVISESYRSPKVAVVGDYVLSQPSLKSPGVAWPWMVNSPWRRWGCDAYSSPTLWCAEDCPLNQPAPDHSVSALPNSARAGLWMMGTVCSFSVMAVAGREASVEFDTFEIMTYRSAGGVVIVLAMALLSGRLGSINTNSLPLHLTRNVMHFAATNFWLLAVATIPLAQVFAFEFSTPIWAAVMAAIFLGERLTGTRILTLAAGFSGILLVAKPGFGEMSPGVMAAILCAIGFAGSAIATRKLVRDTDVICILFWMSAMQTVFGLAIAGQDGDISLPSRVTMLPLCAIALAGISAHYCLTNALKLAPAAVAMPFDFLRLPVIMLVGYVFYSESIDALVIAGGAIILGANYLNIRSESRGVYQVP